MNYGGFVAVYCCHDVKSITLLTNMPILKKKFANNATDLISLSLHRLFFPHL